MRFDAAVVGIVEHIAAVSSRINGSRIPVARYLLGSGSCRIEWKLSRWMAAVVGAMRFGEICKIGSWKLGLTMLKGIILIMLNERGLSQQDFALAVEMDRTYFGGVERGERNVSIDNLERIALGLEVDPSVLLQRA